MKKLVIALLVLLASFTAQPTGFIEFIDEAALSRIIPKNAELKVLAKGMQFLEGPLWISSTGGSLIFSDIPADEIKEWRPTNGLTTFRKPSGKANGNALDANGLLVSCEEGARRLSITEKNGSVRTLVDQFEGKKLNSPNDLVIDSRGVIWFTDPPYAIKPEEKEQSGNFLYRYDPKTQMLSAAARDFDMPNGLCFSPDERLLYVADSGKPRHIRVFSVDKDGALQNGRVFCTIDPGGPDGIRCDAEGRLYSSAGDGVHIFAADGRLIGKIQVPETPSNLCFGGPGNKTLFITARTSLYSIQLQAEGVSPSFHGEKAPEAPITIHPRNPRYFFWKNRPTVLVASGEHYGSVINPDFNYELYLATISAAGLNHTRLFLGDYVEEGKTFGITNDVIEPAPGRVLTPWARSDTPGYAMGGNKFDLDRWEPAYFERLHGFVQEAAKQNIVVEVVLFFIGPGWDNAPLNPKNNVNEPKVADAAQYLSLENTGMLKRQEAYCRKLVGELNPYSNLIFNVCNEPWFYNQEKPGFVSQPPLRVKEWIRCVSDWIADEESRLPNQHLLGVDLSNQGSVITPEDLTGCFARLSVFNVHYDGNADVIAMNRTVPRVFAFNETGFNGVEDQFYRTQGWNFLLSGGALYGNLDFSFTVGHEDGTFLPQFSSPFYSCGGSPALRSQLKILLDFMNSIPFADMNPDNSVVVGGVDQWRALGSSGRAYAIWFPGDGPVEPLLCLTPGEWKFEWVDILTGAITSEILHHDSWVRKIRGERRGGGAALRISRVFPVSVEDFEFYASNKELAAQWYNVWHGGVMRQSLEPVIKSSGKYSLKCAYTTTKSADKFYSPICRVSKWDLSGCNAFRFWLKPDGSGRELTVQFNIANQQGKNIHDLWEYVIHPQKGDKAGRMIIIPFSELVHNIKYADAPDVSPVFKPEVVIEVALYIGGRNDKPGNGAYYFDDMVGIFIE